jgi:sec-independent protein translocase protein TatC
VISQLALAVPMCILYELGIWGARWFVKPTTTEDAQEPPAAV